MVRQLVLLSLLGAPAADDGSLRALRALDGADLVLFPAAATGGDVRVMTLVRATPAAIAAVLTSPAVYREAVPALERAEVVGRRGDSLAVEWELEIPLFNLKGRLWLNARGREVELTFVEGNLAPGRLLFSWNAVDDQTTALSLEARLNVKAGGWMLRRAASSSAFAEPAIVAAAAWVALRAAAARAEHPDAPAARRPQARPTPPATSALDGSMLATPALAPLRTGGAITALVRRSGSGRLAAAVVAAPIQRPADQVALKVATPEHWRAFPGWKRITRVAAPPGAATIDADVSDSLPFVDLDARWRLTTRPVIRAEAIDGATRGALFQWDVFPIDGAGGAKASLAVLAMYPRLEASGYVPRKFVAAEPLLEHGLALALAYVDALSMKAALENEAPPPARPASPPQRPQVPAP